MDLDNINKDSWNKQSKRYQGKADFAFDNVDYGDLRYVTERDLKLIGDVEGKKILELGCGGANCGISLAKQGAFVTCTDISEEQINAAKENAHRENVDINFIVSSMEDLYMQEDEFDVVISMAALGYIKEIETVFQKVKYTLKDKGIFVFTLPDATFSAIGAKHLWNDPVEQHSYFYTGPEKWKWDNEDDFEFVTYRKPISEYINMLTNIGFYIKSCYQLKPIDIIVKTEEEKLEALFPRHIVFKVINFNSPIV
jgi:ubiquinone/menaquinone biosynthesis C-methylase UbiE